MELHKVYSGEEFNKLSNGKKYYKLTYGNENHNGFQFTSGLNVDTKVFNPKGECSPGGIYFTEVKFFARWLGKHFYFREVTIPDDAQVYIEIEKFKADKIILGPRKIIRSSALPQPIVRRLCNTYPGLRRTFSKYLSYNIDITDEETRRHVLNHVTEKFSNIRDLDKEHQTEEMCLAAVTADYRALGYVINQTPEIQAAALAANRRAIIYFKYIPRKTPHYSLEFIYNKPQIIRS